MHHAQQYELTELRSAYSLKFFFVSRGKYEIVKAVEYTLYQQFQGKKVYNLGFGDYDPVSDSFLDEENSNNGDVYRVFRTVLHTIPLFFQYYPHALLMVQGSDSHAHFMKQCLQTCFKNCTKGCKKFDRRIHIYRSFVDKYFDTLANEYLFYGGKRNSQGKILLEKYKVREPYDAIMFERNFVNLGIVSEPVEAFTMKPKIKKPEALSDAELLAPVISKFKDKILFPRLVENAKKMLKDAEFVSE